VSDLIEGNEDPDTNDDTSSENQNDNGAKISHGCSSVKTESMVDRKFPLQSKISHACGANIISSYLHKRIYIYEDMPH
jgi:hypothetical protein